MGNTSKIYNEEYIDFTKEPIFFGDGKNTQRFDVLKYPFFDSQNVKMASMDWVFDEINMTQDRVDFHTALRPNEKFIYTRELQKLIFLDSIQGRGILLTLGQIVTIPEVEACLSTWQYFECNKHSKTYTHNLRNVYDNPTEIFDETFNIEELKGIVDSIRIPYDNAYSLIIEYQYMQLKGIEITEEFFKELKKAVLVLIFTINILEGIRFYKGFASIWAMNKGLNLLEGTSKNLTLIARDENVHLALTQKLIQILKKNEDEGFVEVFNENIELFTKMYQDVYDQECAWVDYTFSQGSLIGLNADITKEYMKYLINRRMKAVGLPSLFPTATKNPIPWIEDYINPDKVEVLPQEGELVNYISGGVDDSVEINVSKFKEKYGKKK